jgi:proteasome lid subunit RPN8/RPN11
MDSECRTVYEMHDDDAGALVLPAEVCLALLSQADNVQRAGLKSFGLFVAEPTHSPYEPTGVVFLDPRGNRRNDPRHRAAFHAQGEYFRRYDDAGFVADPADLLRACRQIDDAGLEIVGMFHSHRRQPPNFSTIDFRLHNSSFPWHLILSYQQGSRPQVRPFGVCKAVADMGISEHDNRRGSELPYPGPEVRPLRLAVRGQASLVDACLAGLAPPTPGGVFLSSRPAR